jgi:hypothetical protein
MSANNSKPTDPSHKDENTTTALKDHIRAFEYAKMQRIVHANANTPAGEGIQRRSSSVKADRPSDHTPLVPKKPHWTTEERWEGQESESREAWERRVSVAADEERRVSMAAAEEPHAGEGAGPAGERKRSLGSKIGGLLGSAATGYVGKKDEFGRYAI